MRFVVPAVGMALLATSSLSAQSFVVSPCPSDNHPWSGGQERVCELRSVTLPLANGQLAVSGTNGGIEVVGESRQNVALEAQVTAQAPNRSDAEAIERDIKVITAGTIHAEGPQFSSGTRKSWYVNYRLHVPQRLAANLHTENGSIKLAGIDGKIEAETTNGSLTLRNLAGDVHAGTINGGMDVMLAGDGWHGAGLHAQSTNGGVSVLAPEGYSAHLIAETVNGGISVDLPVTVEGKLRNHLDTTLGHGGATVDVKTVNGGVSIRKAGERSVEGEE